MTVVAGADGARLDETAGWIVALADGADIRQVVFVEHLADWVEEHEPAVLAVDVPIGHEDPTGEHGGRRAADEAARERLGQRSRSVFATPPIDLLQASKHEDAIAGARDRGAIAPSIQVWNLRSRILELDELVPHEGPTQIVESHPELSFQQMGQAVDGMPADLASKRSYDGVLERVRLLRGQGLEPGPIGDPGRAPPHDVLDALACAWSARRVASGQAVQVPEDAPEDPGSGRVVAIWV